MANTADPGLTTARSGKFRWQLSLGSKLNPVVLLENAIAHAPTLFEKHNHLSRHCELHY